MKKQTKIRPEVGIQTETIWDASSFEVPSFYAPDLKRFLRNVLLSGGIAIAVGLLLQWISAGFSGS